MSSSSRTPPSPRCPDPEQDVLFALEEQGPQPEPRPFHWPPPGSWQDKELERLVEARLFELMAEAGFVVPESQDS